MINVLGLPKENIGEMPSSRLEKLKQVFSEVFWKNYWNLSVSRAVCIKKKHFIWVSMYLAWKY